MNRITEESKINFNTEFYTKEISNLEMLAEKIDTLQSIYRDTYESPGRLERVVAALKQLEQERVDRLMATLYTFSLSGLTPKLSLEDRNLVLSAIEAEFAARYSQSSIL